MSDAVCGQTRGSLEVKSQMLDNWSFIASDSFCSTVVVGFLPQISGSYHLLAFTPTIIGSVCVVLFFTLLPFIPSCHHHHISVDFSAMVPVVSPRSMGDFESLAVALRIALPYLVVAKGGSPFI